MATRPDYEPRKVFIIDPDGGYSLARFVAGNCQGASQQAGGTFAVPELSVKCTGDPSLNLHRIAVWVYTLSYNVTAGGIASWATINAQDKTGKLLMSPVTLTGCNTGTAATGGQLGGCVEVARQQLVHQAYSVAFKAGWRAINDNASLPGNGPGIAYGAPTTNGDLVYANAQWMRPQWLEVAGALDQVTVVTPASSFTATPGVGNEWVRGLVVWVESRAWPL